MVVALGRDGICRSDVPSGVVGLMEATEAMTLEWTAGKRLMLSMLAAEEGRRSPVQCELSRRSCAARNGNHGIHSKLPQPQSTDSE